MDYMFYCITRYAATFDIGDIPNQNTSKVTSYTNFNTGVASKITQLV